MTYGQTASETPPGLFHTPRSHRGPLELWNDFRDSALCDDGDRGPPPSSGNPSPVRMVHRRYERSNSRRDNSVRPGNHSWCCTQPLVSLPVRTNYPAGDISRSAYPDRGAHWSLFIATGVFMALPRDRPHIRMGDLFSPYRDQLMIYYLPCDRS